MTETSLKSRIHYPNRVLLRWWGLFAWHSFFFFFFFVDFGASSFTTTSSSGVSTTTTTGSGSRRHTTPLPLFPSKQINKSTATVATAASTLTRRMKKTTTTTTLQDIMSDFDFPSAMPVKPELTMKEKLEESATQFIADISSRLDENVLPPPELEALRKARDDGGVNDGSNNNTTEQLLALRIYELMIERGMNYDMDAESGKLKPTQFVDIPNNLHLPEVKQEFQHLYSYGIQLVQRGLIDLETCKDVVKRRLIDRTGLSPEEFDNWLGY